MKVLVFGENSDVVGSAFRALGHDVTSSDLEPSAGSPNHYQGDGRWLLWESWDLMIAHPPCDKPSLRIQRKARLVTKMQGTGSKLRHFGLSDCLYANAPIPRNRSGKPHDRQVSTARYLANLIADRSSLGSSATAYVTKATCLGGWKGLPQLKLQQRHCTDGEWPLLVQSTGCELQARSQPEHGGHRAPRLRSRFHPGIAAAMAQQWGNL